MESYDDSRSFSVALSLGSPPAAVSRYPRSVKPGLSSDGAFRRSPAIAWFTRAFIIIGLVNVVNHVFRVGQQRFLLVRQLSPDHLVEQGIERLSDLHA